MGRKANALPEVARDVHGAYFRWCGFKKTDQGIKPHKFYLGRDRTEAAIRSSRLEQAWSAVEFRWQKAREEPRPIWDETTMQIAQAIARGERVCKLELPSRFYWNDLNGERDDFARGCSFNSNNTAPEMLVSWLRNLQTDFPMIGLALTDEEVQQKGEERIQQDAKDMIRRAEKMLKKNIAQTLHQALDAFAEYLRHRYSDNQGNMKITGQVAMKDVQRIKEHGADVPLCDFDLKAVEALEDYWSKRPLSKAKATKGNPCAPKTCQNTIKRIRMFLRWLHREKDFDWRRDPDYEVRTLRIDLSPQELSARINPDQVPTYIDAELLTLWKYAKPRERLLMLLALNCGFGKDQIALLQMNEIHLDRPHPKFPEVRNWIGKIRNKSRVFSMWNLWDVTVQALKWYQSLRPTSAETCLLVNAEGKALSRQTSGGNMAQSIPNNWRNLTLRIRKLEDASFRRLSFNKLKKTATDAIRDDWGGELAGIFNSRGKPVSSDHLIDLYSNRPFRRLFDAINAYGARIAPIFNSVPDPFSTPKRKHKKPERFREKQAQAIALREQGLPYHKIAEVMGVTSRMVRHYLELAGKTRKQGVKPPGWAEQGAQVMTFRSQGKTIREIAGEMGIGVPLVRRHLEEARKAAQLSPSQGERDQSSNGT